MELSTAKITATVKYSKEKVMKGKVSAEEIKEGILNNIKILLDRDFDLLSEKRYIDLSTKVENEQYYYRAEIYIIPKPRLDELIWKELLYDRLFTEGKEDE